MDAIRIRGTRKLQGPIQVGAAKSAALPSRRVLTETILQVGADMARINIADDD